jgi:hypothetical protein
MSACGGGGGGSDAAAAGSDAAAASSVSAAAGSVSAAAGPVAAAAGPDSAAAARDPKAVASGSASTGDLPASVLACYFTAWNPAYNITKVPLDFNVIYLFNAQPQGTDGTFHLANLGESQISAASVQAVRARGQKVLLTCGGAGAGFNFDTRSKSANFVASFQTLYDALQGVDGCDFNNFEAGIGSSPSEMVWIAGQLKALYGPHFAITCPPNPDGSFAPNDRALTAALSNAGLLTYAGPQFYDWSGFKVAGVVKNYIDQWVTHLGDAQQVMVGLSADYDFTNSLTLDECVREFNAIKAAHPTIRGAFCWDAQTNIAAGNVWDSAMKRLV